MLASHMPQSRAPKGGTPVKNSFQILPVPGTVAGQSTRYAQCEQLPMLPSCPNVDNQRGRKRPIHVFIAVLGNWLRL